MLNLHSVNNISRNCLLNTKFNIGIFGSGFESRASHLAKNIDLKNFDEIIAFGFEEHRNVAARLDNDEFYKSNKIPIYPISATNENEIYPVLKQLLDRQKAKKHINILIDYTSMSRLWYSGLLYFIRFFNIPCNVYLNYSIGEYEKKLIDFNYSSINSLPSHEGSLSSNNKTLLIVSIGFNPFVVKSTIEEIEPNEVIGILPMYPKYKDLSLSIKSELTDINNWIYCSISDLENIFRTYSEIVGNNLFQRDIIFLPLGPKIFTMASILVCQRFEHATCLYLKSNASKFDDIRPSGDLICNYISYGRLNP